MANKSTSVFPLPTLIVCLTIGTLLVLPAGNLAAQEQARETALCLDCHEGQDTTLAGTVHMLRDGDDTSGTPISCTDCHGYDDKHWNDDPESNPMIKPAGLNATAEAKLCAQCHQSSHQQNMLEGNVHANNGVTCSDCHGVHGDDGSTALLKQEEPALCYGCHENVEGDFARSYRHPVSDGVVKCSECHMQLDETRRELSLNGTNVCYQCHAEFQGPFPFEHQATLDYSTEEGGCLTCHAAHGSDNPRILQQPYEPPHFQLCTQCHMVPPGHLSNMNHGASWAGVACNECHTDVHGSYDNRFFLSESLRADGCLTAGCHGR